MFRLSFHAHLMLIRTFLVFGWMRFNFLDRKSAANLCVRMYSVGSKIYDTETERNEKTELRNKTVFTFKIAQYILLNVYDVEIYVPIHLV